MTKIYKSSHLIVKTHIFLYLTLYVCRTVLNRVGCSIWCFVLRTLNSASWRSWVRLLEILRTLCLFLSTIHCILYIDSILLINTRFAKLALIALKQTFSNSLKLCTSKFLSHLTLLKKEKSAKHTYSALQVFNI